jgi:hypothetical protein
MCTILNTPVFIAAATVAGEEVVGVRVEVGGHVALVVAVASAR